MRPSEKIIEIWDQLGLPAGEAILVGSGPMAMRDMRDVGDLDIFCTTMAWWEKSLNRGGWGVTVPDRRSLRRRNDPLLAYKTFEAGGQQIEVNLFHAWRYRAEEGGNKLDLSGLITRAEHVKGIPCMPLPELIAWKLEAGRDKDMKDIAAIAAYLTGEG